MRLPSTMMRLLRSGSSAGIGTLLMLSFAACDSSESEPESTGDLGAIQGEYDGAWQYFSANQVGQLKAPIAFATPEVSRLAICGVDRTPTLEDRNSKQLCFVLNFDTALLETGPATLAIQGVAEVPPGEIDSARPAFTPGAGHAPSVLFAYATITCSEGALQESNVRQEVTGTLQLRTNDASTFAGRLVLDAAGQTSGRCSALKSRTDVEFSIQRL